MISFSNVRTEWFGPVTFEAAAGTSVKIVAASREAAGAFMRVAAGLAKPDSGEVKLFGENIYTITEEEYIHLMKDVGLVTHSEGMISNLQTYENVALPALYHRRKTIEQLEALTSHVLASLGIPQNQGEIIMRTPPHLLKPYQKVILRIIRAQAMEPVLMIYEELIGQLPDDIGKYVIQLAMEFHRQSKERVSMFVTCDESTLKPIPTAGAVFLNAARQEARS